MLRRSVASRDDMSCVPAQRHKVRRDKDISQTAHVGRSGNKVERKKNEKKIFYSWVVDIVPRRNGWLPVTQEGLVCAPGALVPERRRDARALLFGCLECMGHPWGEPVGVEFL